MLGQQRRNMRADLSGFQSFNDTKSASHGRVRSEIASHAWNKTGRGGAKYRSIMHITRQQLNRSLSYLVQYT